MIPTRITEKTLELNVCEEYLRAIRRSHPKAFWYGPSTVEEKDLGYDASIEGAEGYALFIQFKKPLHYSGVKPKIYPYIFKVRVRQHQTLKQLSGDYPGSVQYAFPMIGDKEELKQAIPNLRGETFFCELEATPDLLENEDEHSVDVYPDRAVFHSEPKSASGYLGPRIGRVFREKLVRLRAVSFIDFVGVYDRLLEAFAYSATRSWEVMIVEAAPCALFIPVE